MTRTEVPVHDLHAERGAISSMLIDAMLGDADQHLPPPRPPRSNACYIGITRLTSHHFHSLRHQAIFRAICSLYEEGAPAGDLILINRRVADSPTNVGGMFEYLEHLLGYAPNSWHIGQYCDELEKLRLRRDKTQLAIEAADLYQSGNIEAADALLTKATETMELNQVVPTQDMQVTQLEDELSKERAGAPPGITTGFQRLDRLIGGFKPAGSYVLAGLTSMGKTALALQLVTAAALAGEPVHYWSMEMSATQLLRRMAAGLAGVSLASAKLRKMTEEEREKLDGALSILRNAPITIDAKTRSLPQMIRQARGHKGRVRLYVVDHARLVDVPTARSEYQAVTEVSSACKSRIAGACEASVLVLSQFNREAAKDGGQGKSHQLRGSGALEEDADVLMAIGRDSYQGKSDSPKASLNVIKNRLGGECGVVKLQWDGVLGRFFEPREDAN